MAILDPPIFGLGKNTKKNQSHKKFSTPKKKHGDASTPTPVGFLIFFGGMVSGNWGLEASALGSESLGYLGWCWWVAEGESRKLLGSGSWRGWQRCRQVVWSFFLEQNGSVTLTPSKKLTKNLKPHRRVGEDWLINLLDLGCQVSFKRLDILRGWKTWKVFWSPSYRRKALKPGLGTRWCTRNTPRPCKHFRFEWKKHQGISGQIITTSAEVTLNGGLVRESLQNPLNSGLGITVY